MMEQVMVTGMGVVTALGTDVQANHQRLKLGQSGIGKARYFESVFVEDMPFAEVPLSNQELMERLKIGSNMGYTRTCLLAELAFEEAVHDAGLSPERLSHSDTAFISASTVGGMCLTDQLYADANLQSSGSSFLASYSGSAHAMKIIAKHRLTGFTNTINTACSSSANAIMLGARLIRSGRAKRAVVGGVDSLAKYTVNGFNALKILSSQPTKPFDQSRDGLNLGEGAGYLVLEAASVLADKRTYGVVAGYGNANDAHHASAMSEEAVGALRAMREALAVGQLTAPQIDYVNSHGTGTVNNDEVELHALQTLFGDLPHFNSTKSYTGHTLGASGAIEAIFSLLSLGHGEVYPSLHTEAPIAGIGTALVRGQSQALPLNWALSNSFGFGGNCTSILLGRARA
ncbi:3-oxoacyl-(acyl-carrier-protein) synthase [Dyadobacter jejuensis]|uniref:3-oxoacyl-(Acyl-carrier-protein) synthase n=1 Tax=Dyadobacter jejuensis TaxID=1082580 RepID=A0A316AM56_9BACT|nr:beta-ketoacyl-[acyl-carrier-protein] synthase family protein [Dyadobacter jejuensis]PWJ58518.1 3-oxoacyl-(acyl-carrier-protein) synthase [Dyadobacter jejuensis]